MVQAQSPLRAITGQEGAAVGHLAAGGAVADMLGVVVKQLVLRQQLLLLSERHRAAPAPA